MRSIYISALLLLFFNFSSFAQSKFALTYSVGFPTGETSDLFSSTSWRGVGLDYQYFIEDKFAIGFSTGWQVFNDDLGYVTETTGTQTISGYRFNYLNSLPFYATASYIFKTTGEVQPYGTLGIGLVYNEIAEDTGLFRNETKGWPLSVRPELGLDYRIGYGVALRGALRYQYVASGSDLPSLSYFSANVGFVWGN
jgi:hypothetical protein